MMVRVRMTIPSLTAMVTELTLLVLLPRTIPASLVSLLKVRRVEPFPLQEKEREEE